MTAADDENSLGNLLLKATIITEKQLKKALDNSEMAKALGDKTHRLGDALARMGISRELIEQVARKQAAERLHVDESSTHITAQMASSNIAQTERLTAMAERATALAGKKMGV